MSKLTKFGYCVATLALISPIKDHQANGINLHQHEVSTGIFSSMIDAENEKELRETAKQETQDRRKQDMQEYEKEHQQAVKEEEDEVAQKEKEEKDIAEQAISINHHEKAFERLNQLSPIMLDNTNAQLQAVQSLAEAVATQEGVDGNSQIIDQLRQIDSMAVQLSAEENPVDGSEDSNDAVDSESSKKIPGIASVDPNGVGADRFKSDDSSDATDQTAKLKSANASVDANSTLNSTSNTSKNSSINSNENSTKSSNKTTSANETSNKNASKQANSSSAVNKTQSGKNYTENIAKNSTNSTNSTQEGQENEDGGNQPLQANVTSNKSNITTKKNKSSTPVSKNETDSKNKTSVNATSDNNQTSESNSTAPENETSSSNSTVNETLPIKNKTNSTLNKNGSKSTNGSIDVESDKQPQQTDKQSNETDVSSSSSSPLPSRYGKKVVDGVSMNGNDGVDKVNSKPKNETKTKNDLNSVNSVLPYPIKLYGDKVPSPTRAKSSQYRPAKYLSNYEKPSYGAPESDASGIDFSQIKNTTKHK